MHTGLEHFWYVTKESFLEAVHTLHDAPLINTLIAATVFCAGTLLFGACLSVVALVVITEKPMSIEFWIEFSSVSLFALAIITPSFLVMRFYWRRAKLKYPTLTRTPQ